MRTYLLQLFQHVSLFKKGLAGALTGAERDGFDDFEHAAEYDDLA
jgi:hypothetical protein